MSFFNFDPSETPTDGSFDAGGGDMEPIPAKTQVLAAPDEAKWDERNDEEFISIRWAVMAPEEYKNRKVFQKVRVLDSDPKKAEKAKRMLAAIDANAGGKLMKANKMPTDKDLTVALCNKPMVLMLQVWELETDDGGTMSGNWVSKVSPRKGGPAKAEKKEPEPEQKASDEDDGDDLPF